MQNHVTSAPFLDGRMLLRPEEAALTLSLSRSRIYELIANGTLPSIKIGNSRRVPTDALRTWISNQYDASPEIDAA